MPLSKETEVILEQFRELIPGKSLQKIKKSGDINISIADKDKEESDYSLLDFAVIDGHADLTKVLIHQCDAIGIKASNNLFQLAVQMSQLEVLEVLLDALRAGKIAKTEIAAKD